MDLVSKAGRQSPFQHPIALSTRTVGLWFDHLSDFLVGESRAGVALTVIHKMLDTTWLGRNFTCPVSREIRI
jgi:hypothetical protein